ncbi:MAG: Rrf2 family transcriptional regulator, partial [Firmicutes bacterium]|nr:Rrf2 family transcriptional regulator [Bacillota bacterium]
MRLSTRSEYGVIACCELARHHGEGPLPLKAVAEEQGIPEAYLEQLVAALRRAGLVRSVRGAQGGYVLSRSPEKITVGDVVRVLEGP